MQTRFFDKNAEAALLERVKTAVEPLVRQHPCEYLDDPEITRARFALAEGSKN